MPRGLVALMMSVIGCTAVNAATGHDSPEMFVTIDRGLVVGGAN
jgi:hypothetical protein